MVSKHVDILKILTTDLKLIFRDKMLLSLAILTPVIIFVVIYFLPQILNLYPPVVPYHIPVIALLLVQMGSMFAFIYSFIMLDEKDSGLYPVYNVTKTGLIRFLSIRFISTLFFGIIINLLIISLSTEYSLLLSCIYGFSFSLTIPLMSMLVISLASNKIEGLTVFKILNLVIILPFIDLLLEVPFSSILKIIPFYWLYASFIDSGNGISTVINLVIYGCSSIIFLVVLFIRFKRKNIDSI